VSGKTRVAWFVTPHGFGHAARTAAIVEALGRRLPDCEVDLWTSVPRWFFEESLIVAFRHHELCCDVGLVQKSPVEEDLAASLLALEEFWGAAESFRTRQVAAEVTASGAAFVLCDIAPFGLDVARASALPSVLIENFTWDWIYEPLAEAEPRFAFWADRLSAKFALADLRLQLEPVCRPAALAARVPLVARAPRQGRELIFERLGIPRQDALALVSLGGVEHRLTSLAPLTKCRQTTFVIPGASREESWEGNRRLLPHHSPILHPDLVAAADVVVGKLGYSTVAEAVGAGTRMLYVPRPGFRESEVLAGYVAERIPAAPIALAELESGEWVERLPEMLARARPAAVASAGADLAADRIAEWWRRQN